MTVAPQPGKDMPDVKFLKILVTVLTGTMIVGLVVIMALIVIKFRADTNAAINLPASIVLPAGEKAVGFTMGTSWYAVVTQNDNLLIYDRATGGIRQTVTLSDD